MTNARTRLRSSATALGEGIAILLLAGCVTNEPVVDSKEECTSADWETVGLTDGKAGRNAGYIAVHRDNCATFQVVPNLSSYEKGYTQGLLEYCTKERGYQEGQRNKTYLNACPEELEGPFKEGYSQGLAAYRDQKKYREGQLREGSMGGVETVTPTR